jgi:hypothetical protein
MSLQTLLESANPYHSVQSDAARLAEKWEKTGLLEGLNGATKSNMGMILENQAKQLVVEQSSTGGGASSAANFTAGQGEQWAGVALPLVRKVFGQIAAQDFVSVQPMNLPSGLVFYLDFQYNAAGGGQAAGGSLYGNASGFASNDTSGGLFGAGRFGYSINNVTKAGAAATVTTASWSDLNFDTDYSSSAIANDYRVVSIADGQLENLDREGIRAFQLNVDGGSSNVQLAAFTRRSGSVASGGVEFIALGSDVDQATLDVEYALQPTDQHRGDFEDGATGLSPKAGSISIPEINVQMKSSAIVAKTRKLKAVWTPEFAQDLNAYHALDAEAELTSILSEYISLEIDLEILDMLMENASAGTEVWSAVNNKSIVDDGADGTINSQLGFYNSQGQWFQTLGTKVQKLSNIIHQKTLRGGANFMVLSPKVSTIIESIPGFGADVDGDVEKQNYAFGVQKIGALGGGKIKVYKNPYMTENQILLGFRGTQFLESGAVFAPYIPLIMTPLVYDPDSFTPRKGLLTRYAKKMVRPEFYGLIKVEGLNSI